MNQRLQSFLKAEIESLRSRGIFRMPKVLEGPAGPRVRIDGREIIQLSSNNYLGLTTHPRVIEAARRALEEFGAGPGAVRSIAGTMSLHLDLERRLARFKGTESALVFQSGYTANVGVVSTLMQEGDLIVSDELNHASIIDGCRLCKADRAIYRHLDYGHLREILRAARAGKTAKILVVADGVFSMDGDVSDLRAIADLCQEFDAIPMVDDAHATGVMGTNGRGTVDHFGVKDRWDIQIGTMSKAFGVMGGYVCCSTSLMEFYVHKARPFLFSSSHPPAVIAACAAAVEVMESEPELNRRLWENTRFFKEGLRRLGFNTGTSVTPITPVIIGSGAGAARFSDELFARGVFAQGIFFPMVAEEKSRVRTIVMATHTRRDLEEALGIFAEVGRRLGVIGRD
ncbi:MAG TPA: glycine C-acetyltransferase [Candidatus Polarisedimenticolia bacterium]|nr:glycine C-acetyltransferase [Candidatus Polarisedimenticolia bacterium]